MSKTKPTASATVIPALTTTFTPSPSCFSKNVHETTPGSLCVSGAQTIDCKWTQLGPTSSISDCLPPGWNAYGTPYYSPGVCPSGYSINDCLSVKVINETIRETRGTCCPIGYSCQTKTVGPDIPVWQSTNFCYQNSTTTQFQETNTDSGTKVGQIKTVDVLHAHGISIRWQDTAHTTSTATASPNGDAGSSDSLSTGAKAGAGVGAAIGFVLLVLTAVILYFKLGRRKASPSLDEPTEQRPYADNPQELDATQVRSELSATQVTSELPGERYTYTAELPGS